MWPFVNRPFVDMPESRPLSRKLGFFLFLNFVCCIYIYFNLTDNTWKSVTPRIKNVYAQYDQSKKADCDYDCQIQVQQFRKDTLTTQCAEMGHHLPYGKKGLNGYEIRRLHLNHIYVMDDLKIMYCSIPKAGSSNWKRILLALNGSIRSVDSIHQYKIHSTINRKAKLLGSFRFAEIIKRLRDYKKFVFVRHPLTRLLSAYRNKLERKSSPFLKEFGRKIKAPWFPKMWRESYLNNVTFAEFVDYLQRRKASPRPGPEEHWSEMFRLCEPCSVGYDFIGKMETANRDADFVLDRILNVTDDSRVFFMNESSVYHLTGSSNVNTVKKFYGNLSQKTIKGLYERYKPDFRLFGYKIPGYLKPNITANPR